MKKLLVILTVLISFNARSQSLTVSPVDYFTACSKLLDMGYQIRMKDNDLQTAQTFLNHDTHIAIRIRVKADGTMNIVAADGDMIIITPRNKKQWKNLETFAAIFGNPVLDK